MSDDMRSSHPGHEILSNDHTQRASTEVTLDKIRQYWQEACDLTADIDGDRRFTTPELVDYLNEHLPSDCESITKTKVNYLRDQEILDPEVLGTGKRRTSWRYTPGDARRTLVTELLKARAGVSVQEIKGWLQSFEEARRVGLLAPQELRAAARTTPPPPTPATLAYALLRNRTLGTLISALGRGGTEVTPRECLIALRVLGLGAEVPQPRRVSSWEEAHRLLKAGSWYIAAADPHLKLYLYPGGVEQLVTNRPEAARALPQHRWYAVTLQDTTDQLYEVVLGLPERDVQQPSIEAIDHTLAKQIEEGSPLALSDFPDLTTLLTAAFVHQPEIEGGTTLRALAEIIAAASNAWEYCAVLVPERSGEGVEKWLHVQEHSSKFPRHLKDKPVEVGRFLSGWCYRYRHAVVVEPAVEGDPRIPFYEEERPTAAAAVPAIVTGDEEQQIVGVVYVGRRQSLPEREPVFSKELIASLRAFGHVCGDVIARDRIEVGTVRGIARLCVRPLVPYQSFSDLGGLLWKVAHVAEKRMPPEDAPHSWIYLLTLNIWTPPQLDPRLDMVTRWLCQQAADVTGDFMANRLWEPPRRVPLPIGQCEVGPGQFVFAVLSAVDLPEERYKERLIAMQEELGRMRIERLPTEFYPWGVTFRYEHLRRDFIDQGPGLDALVDHLVKLTRGALAAGPYISRGHEALRKPDLDQAVTEFQDALRYAPENWYVYKHLAEARMLQGQVEQAVEQCKIALKLNPRYASTHCLLADCLSYQGKYGAALTEYERALRLNSTRPDFLTRYGVALAGMTPSQYREAREELARLEPELARRRFYPEPYQEAIDKFERARKLSEGPGETPEEQRARRAEYHYQRGYAHLQAEHLDKAIEDFAIGQKLAPNDLRLAQAYAYALSLERRQQGGDSSTGIGRADENSAISLEDVGAQVLKAI